MHRSIATVRYWRPATKVGFGGIVYWVIERVEILKPGHMDSLGAVLDAEIAGKLTSWLQQAQLAGARYRFGAPPNLEFAKDVAVVSFDGNDGEEEPLAYLTVREPLGDESQHL